MTGGHDVGLEDFAEKVKGGLPIERSLPDELVEELRKVAVSRNGIGSHTAYLWLQELGYENVSFGQVEYFFTKSRREGQ